MIKYKSAKHHRFYDLKQLQELPGVQLLDYLVLTTCPGKTVNATRAF